MEQAVIKKSDMERWFAALKAKASVMGPKRKGPSYVFGPVGSFEEMSLTYIPTIIPPKKYYFPPKEALVAFKISSNESREIDVKLEPLVLFGVHTCDIAGIQCLDVVFHENPPDPYYHKRKEGIAVIGIECLERCDRHASCVAVGTHDYQGGHDIMLTDLGDAYALHINSDRGEALVAKKPYIRSMTDEDRERLKKVRRDKAQKFQNEFKGDLGEIDRAFRRGFDSPVWKDVGRRCVGCTNCTAVCPTCYCFDVHDELGLDLDAGERSRAWSFCQMRDFARVATGEDFRPGRDERQRHRYYRKFIYSVDKYKKYFCTGCGRCTRTCMAQINLVETVNALIEDKGGA
jgi:sulfhydrogenase subunit beta (sulfur reductase)